jgi:hypothetical protein
MVAPLQNVWNKRIITNNLFKGAVMFYKSILNAVAAVVAVMAVLLVGCGGGGGDDDGETWICDDFLNFTLTLNGNLTYEQIRGLISKQRGRYSTTGSNITITPTDWYYSEAGAGLFGGLLNLGIVMSGGDTAAWFSAGRWYNKEQYRKVYIDAYMQFGKDYAEERADEVVRGMYDAQSGIYSNNGNTLTINGLVYNRK